MNRKIIAFAGLIGAGKTTAAMYLVKKYGYKRIRFAGALKNMMYALGLNEREIDGDLKEQPCELLGGKSPRYAMQTIGTEWGRNLIDSNLWVNVWKHQVNQLPDNVCVVNDDCRFLNELKSIREVSSNSLIVRIGRPELELINSKHASEKQDFPVDLTIVNDGNIEDLFQKIEELLCANNIYGLKNIDPIK